MLLNRIQKVFLSPIYATSPEMNSLTDTYEKIKNKQFLHLSKIKNLAKKSRCTYKTIRHRIGALRNTSNIVIFWSISYYHHITIKNKENIVIMNAMIKIMGINLMQTLPYKAIKN